MTSIQVLIFTDGRHNMFRRTVASLWEHVTGPIGTITVIDDSDDPEYAEYLAGFDGIDRIVHHVGRRGFGGAIQSGWDHVDPEATHVFHLEDDFVFNEDIDLGKMVEALDYFPHLAQLVLKRQPWNEQEKAAGGIVEMWPNQYLDLYHPNGMLAQHRLFWSTNPSVYRVAFTGWRWPEGEHSEAWFSQEIFNQGFSVAFWGSKWDPPKVTHIGEYRAGTGY